MERYLVETEDGSHSLFVPALDEQYHSRHGAIQESRHVFLQMGFAPAIIGKTQLRILEIGLGTGLNALLTAVEAHALHVTVHYCAIEAYPLTAAEVGSLNYPTEIGGVETQSYWDRIHTAPWAAWAGIHPQFYLQKLEQRLEAMVVEETVDLIYFDAFAPDKQPELWTEEVFGRMYGCLNPGGLLLTYCAKGAVRRAMQAAGFTVERIPGPPGKREMIRASKPA
jgi:tRNA U34 5-methylaminomethyl-2-thiouridine-forming methyltransferase MnmC